MLAVYRSKYFSHAIFIILISLKNAYSRARSRGRSKHF